MKVLGIIALSETDTASPIEYVPMDGTSTEFRPLDRCPPQLLDVIIGLCDSNDATPIGVLVDLGESTQP